MHFASRLLSGALSDCTREHGAGLTCCDKQGHVQCRSYLSFTLLEKQCYSNIPEGGELLLIRRAVLYDQSMGERQHAKLNTRQNGLFILRDPH